MCQRKPDIRFARIVVDVTVEVVRDGHCEHPGDVRIKLSRALALALSHQGHQERAETVCSTLIEYERTTATDDQLGHLGPRLRHPLGGSAVHAPLNQVIRKKQIIADLEAHTRPCCHKRAAPF